jgi:hypothetical protein
MGIPSAVLKINYLITYSCKIGFFLNFGEISYLASIKKNRNNQGPGLKLTGNFIEKGVIDKNESLK